MSSASRSLAEVLALDATGQAERIAAGDVTAAELLEASLARIDEVNPALNAVVVPLADKARRAVAAGLPDADRDAPFRGVPTLVKDLVATTAGDRYGAGLRPMVAAEIRAPRDSFLVGKLRAAGFVI